MDDYITREAVVQYLKEYSDKEASSFSPFSIFTTSVLDQAEMVLSEMPAADVQRVKHGQWILHTKRIADIEIKLPTECSECGFEEFSAEKYNFCPECGAKMLK